MAEASRPVICQHASPCRSSRSGAPDRAPAQRQPGKPAISASASYLTSVGPGATVISNSRTVLGCYAVLPRSELRCPETCPAGPCRSGLGGDADLTGWSDCLGISAVAASALPLLTQAESGCCRQLRVNTVAVCADEPPARHPAGYGAGPAVRRRPGPEAGLPSRPRVRLHPGVMRYHLLTAEGPEGTWRLSGLIDFEPTMHGAREYEFADVGVFAAGPVAGP